MTKELEFLYDIIKKQNYADPFSSDFNLKHFLDEFGKGSPIKEDERNIISFLGIINAIYEEYKKNIYEIFDKLQLSPVDLREFCFIEINKYFFDSTQQIRTQFEKGLMVEADKINFTKFTDESGQTTNAQLAIEMGPDMLSMIILFSQQWKVVEKDFVKLSNLRPNIYQSLFSKLCIYVNILLNLRDAAYNKVKYETGKVIIRKANEFKIETSLNIVSAFNTVGVIRANSITSQNILQLIPIYKKGFGNRIGVANVVVNKNILVLTKGKSEPSIKARADSSLFVFYPHFIDDKLEYFDGLTLHDLLDLLTLIEESFEIIERQNLINNSELGIGEVPIKFREKELINFLSDASGVHINSIKKFIVSITANSDYPYFWREPLFKSDNFLYFAVGAISAPNHVLLLDKWTSLNGFTLEDKERKFTKFVIDSLKEPKKNNFQFNFIDFSELKLNKNFLQNNILIETTSLLILLEIKLFDFPIESSEIYSAYSRLGNATFDIENKATQIIENLNSQKELIKIIVTNYTNFSGLVINNIPIADLELFKNYVIVGNIRRGVTTSHGVRPIVNDIGILTYYRNEDEFNMNLKSFFMHPIPIRLIHEKLYLIEQEIMPEPFSAKFIVDSIDYLSDSQLMESRMNNLNSMLNYEYFVEPKDDSIVHSLDESIIYSLSEIFSRLSYSDYEFYQNRIELYNNLNKTKILGFAHLTIYLFKALGQLNGKKIKKNNEFEKIEYESKEVFEILKSGEVFLSSQLRLSDFIIEDNKFSETEEKKIISFSIDALSELTPKHFDNEFIATSLLPLALLHGLSHKYDVEFEFYSACSNIVDALNLNHNYQPARDFCEEILLLSIKQNKHSHGWNILFKCYTNQKNTFDASINGCLFLTSLSVQPEISNYLAVDSLYGALKFFRNFGLTELTKNTYESLQLFNLSEYDKQKVTLSYFNSFLHGEILHNIDILDQVVDYVENNIDNIIYFKEHGVIPWLAFFYNIERLKLTKQISYKTALHKYIDKFEKSIDKSSVDDIRLKILGESKNLKKYFISALLNTFETRSIQDFVHETQQLSLIASNLLQSALINEDIDGILLSGLIINDQSSTYKDIFIESGSTLPFSKSDDSELKLRFNNYKYYVLSKIKLKTNQLLIWLFEDLGKVYFLSLNSFSDFQVISVNDWDVKKMKEWLKNIDVFYFNSNKDKYYDSQAQEADYHQLINELSFTTLLIPSNIEELFIYSSIELSSFPHNLIQNSNKFISTTFPVCNIVSIERFIEKCMSVNLTKTYSVSAWIPIEDQEPTISWGFGILKDTLKNINAKIFPSTYPSEPITSDLNIFLAHGVTDSLGFKAVYTNHADNKVIIYPSSVFGKGEVAILFICNSGSSREALYSNSVISFSNELLKLGYQSVIAPFWPFDVTMSKIWLDEFLKTFNAGFSINEAVWFANSRLATYDKTTSSIYYAPAGCLAMHLYGNPNVYVDNN